MSSGLQDTEQPGRAYRSTQMGSQAGLSLNATDVTTATRRKQKTTPLSPAERMHRHRNRRRAGLRCLMVELRETEVDALVRKGLLTNETRNDANAVRDALYAHLDSTLGQAS